MKNSFEVMVNSDDLIALGFKPYQSKRMIRDCKNYLAQVEGIDLYYNRQVRVVPARIIEKLFNIKVEE